VRRFYRGREGLVRPHAREGRRASRADTAITRNLRARKGARIAGRYGHQCREEKWEAELGGAGVQRGARAEPGKEGGGGRKKMVPTGGPGVSVSEREKREVWRVGLARWFGPRGKEREGGEGNGLG
jgi:hypothetical protein